MNLVDTVRGYATPKLAESISAVLGITPERIAATLDSAIPGLLAAIAARAQTPEETHTLARTLGEIDDSILADPAGAVRHQGATLMNRGGDVLGSLLGGAALTALIGAIGRYTGKSPSSVRSIVGLFAPVVLAILRRERTAANLDEAGLARLLADQKPHIMAAIPPGLARYLATAPNVGALGEYIRVGTAAAPPAAPRPTRPLLHADPAPAAAAVASGSAAHTSGAVRHTAGGSNGSHSHRHTLQYHRPKRRKTTPAWVWAGPAIGCIGLGWLIIASLGGPTGGTASVADAGTSQVVRASTAGSASAPMRAAAPAATPESVREEVDAIINATAIALGSVRDAATAETVASTLKELSERLDAVKRSFDRLPDQERRIIAGRVSDALSSRLRNAFQRAYGDDEVRRRLGPLTEAVARKLADLKPE